MDLTNKCCERAIFIVGNEAWSDDIKNIIDL